MLITNENLSKALGKKIDPVWADLLNDVCTRYAINTNLRLCHFLAQIAHESARLSVLEENLFYSAAGLLKTFPKYFNPTTALKFAKNPKAIASRVYANRMGNGNEASGDGFTYHGRGCIQVTGKTNYINCGKYLGIDLIKNPELLIMPKYALESATWFWVVNNLNALADKDDINSITKKINGGVNGLDDRKAILSKCKSIFNKD